MSTFQGRTFDCIPSPPDHRNWQLADLLAAKVTRSPSERLQDAQIAALAKRVTALEAPVPPTPPIPPVPPTPPVPGGAVLFDVPVDLDQGAEGECVGFGTTHAILGSPNGSKTVSQQILDNPTAETIYQNAQKIDGQTPDEQSGTSVLAGLKAAKALGLIVAYHQAASMAEVQQAFVTGVGGALWGTDWHQDMMNPDASGQIHVTGPVVGGHCYWTRGYDPATDQYLIHNSWGTGWGRNGDALISSADLAKLLAASGEAWLVTKSAS